MGIWFGFPLAFVVCLVSALFGFGRVVPMQVTIWITVICVGGVWLVALYEALDDIMFSWSYWRDARQERDQQEIITGRKWLSRDLLFLIFSPFLALGAIAVGGVLLLYLFFSLILGELPGLMIEKLRNQV